MGSVVIFCDIIEFKFDRDRENKGIFYSVIYNMNIFVGMRDDRCERMGEIILWNWYR
jgi:hypothetical protein